MGDPIPLHGPGPTRPDSQGAGNGDNGGIRLERRLTKIETELSHVVARRQDVDALRDAQRKELSDLKDSQRTETSDLKDVIRTEISDLKSSHLKWAVGVLLGVVIATAAAVGSLLRSVWPT